MSIVIWVAIGGLLVQGALTYAAVRYANRLGLDPVWWGFVTFFFSPLVLFWMWVVAGRESGPGKSGFGT